MSESKSSYMLQKIHFYYELSKKTAKHLLLKFILLYNHVQMCYQKKSYEKFSK